MDASATNDPAAALRSVARWCVEASGESADDDGDERADRPALVPVYRALAAAVADPAADAFDTLAAALARWAREGRTAGGLGYDLDALAPLTRGATDAARLCADTASR